MMTIDKIKNNSLHDRNQKFIVGGFSHPLRSFSPASKWPLKSSKEIRWELLAPPAGRRTTFAATRHVPCALFHISVKRNLKTEANALFPNVPVP